MTKEAAIEEFFVARVKSRGGFAPKLIPVVAGLPDRLAFLPGGRLLLVELKKPKGGVVSPIQRVIHDRLAALGFPVHVISTRAQIEELIP